MFPTLQTGQPARSARRPILLAFSLSLSLAVGCVIPPPMLALDPRTPVRIMADSASHLATDVTTASDSASTQITLALSEPDSLQMFSMVRGARDASHLAGIAAGTAIEKGDRLHAILVDSTSGSGRDYARYWAMGRFRLDLARQRAAAAERAAQLSLACAAEPCGRLMVREALVHVEAAAGAAREAESVVRIAMRHVN